MWLMCREMWVGKAWAQTGWDWEGIWARSERLGLSDSKVKRGMWIILVSEVIQCPNYLTLIASNLEGLLLSWLSLSQNDNFERITSIDISFSSRLESINENGGNFLR